MPNTTPFRSSCPISCALDLVGDKWSMLILRDMLFFNKKTFKELSTSKEKIATNILANRLSKLESLGLIMKSSHPTNKKTKLYTLKEAGWELLPSMLELFSWFSNRSEDFARAKTDFEIQILAEYRADKEGFVRKFRATREAAIIWTQHNSIIFLDMANGAKRCLNPWFNGFVMTIEYIDSRLRATEHNHADTTVVTHNYNGIKRELVMNPLLRNPVKFCNANQATHLACLPHWAETLWGGLL